MSESKFGVIELVLFKTKSGVTKEKLVQAAKTATSAFEQMNGFVSRDLAVDNEGQWTDILHWQDMQSALTAAQTAIEIEECRNYFALIDETQIKMFHLNKVSSNGEN